MRRRLLWIAAAGAALAGLLAAATFVPPSTHPIPDRLPCIARNPPPRSYSPSTTDNCVRDERVRLLHAAGITGRGVGIAIIDSLLLTTHRDFGSRVRWYDEIDAGPGDAAQWHGTAVASIAAGARCGVAPEADLYFVGLGANWAGQPVENWWLAARRVFTARSRLATGIRRIVAVNRTLPHNRRIRVISLSLGLGPSLFGRGESLAAIDEARRAGIYVSMEDDGTARLGPVVAASPESADAFVKYEAPAASWYIARRAGCYALAAQRDPAITPNAFAAGGNPCP